MASHNFSAVTIIDTCNNSLYFEVTERDLEEDCFQRSKQVWNYWITCYNHKFLMFDGERDFQLRDLTKSQAHVSENQFQIHIYDSSLLDKKGRAVMLYVNKPDQKDGKKIVVCCRNDKEIYAEEMDVPQNIDGLSDKALFYRTELAATNKYMFESTAHQGWFLGFNPSPESCLLKLVLRHINKDQVDEPCEFHLCESKK
ncbi:interleukin-18-like [Brachyistius frenatus]|uniref:interleukin-18-like n=1 Tax=Brachyistius frenatus TaxID=100188 RepID=UPI0037E8032A